MCGIAGFYQYRNDNLIKKFSSQLAHRGPNGEGTFITDDVSLLIRRLAIIDLKSGDQPIFNEDKSVVVVYNGEIYNYRELKKELEKAGHTFTTKTDTEVIVHGYEEWGELCFDRFNGMFAIALFDKKQNKLILVRDQFGIKPLYYSRLESGGFVFSSEIKPIFESGLIKKEPNDKTIYRYLRYRIHDDGEETFFKNIDRLLPGELMILKKDTVVKKTYSTLKKALLNSNKKSKNEIITDEQYKMFEKKLTNAIRLRLISDVTVGTCLSGGIDSSTLVGAVNMLLLKNVSEAESVGQKQQTFSAVFPGSSNNEDHYIDNLLKTMKRVRGHKVNPKPEEFFDEIQDFIKTQEEPTISTGPYAQFKVMQKAQGKVTVLLDGQGADEMMAGYVPYYFVYLRQLKKDGQFRLLLHEVFKSGDVVWKYVWYKFLLTIGVKKAFDSALVIKPEFYESYKNEQFKVTQDNLKVRLIEDIFSNSLQSLLRYEDKNSMRFSIEGRVPFLDVNLLKYMFSLPDRAIIQDGWNKYILRVAVNGLIPDSIRLRRNKIGFTTPELDWFLRMKNRIYSIFLSESFGKRKYFNQAETLKAFQKFIEGSNEDTLLFWRLLNVELWLRIFFDPPKKRIIQQPKHEVTESNPGKDIKIKVNGKQYNRYPLRSDLFEKGDQVGQKIAKYVIAGLQKIKTKEKSWFVAVSEKIVAISQGRSYFIWDINPGFFAKLLSKHVKKTPYGIGLGSPWTMQLAIQEAGLLRILLASVISAVTKPMGLKGVFYYIAGRNVASIDGPTEYSLYPSNVSAKLGPKNPQRVAKEIHSYLLQKLPKTRANTFQGVAIIDANDLGCTILGNSTDLRPLEIQKIFKDNPMGQAREQTPIVVVMS